jgi:hypothetical protein
MGDMLAINYDRLCYRYDTSRGAGDTPRLACDRPRKKGDTMPTERPILVDAGHVLGLGQEGVGKIMGVSGRTIQRWGSGSGLRLIRPHAESLARAVYPKDAELAAHIAAAAGTTLQELGIASVPPGPRAGHLVDSLVCAAAEAMDVLPRLVRPGLLAAFARALEMGLTVEMVHAALAGPIEPAKGRTRRPPAA